MPSTVEQLSPSRVKLTIEIPFSELQPHLDKAYKEIAQSVTVPGFRRGKVPAAIIDQRFGRGTVLQEAINAALPVAYSKAVEEANIIPLAEPEIDVTNLEDRKLVEFTAEVDVRPDFEIPELSTLSATVQPLASTDDQVDERIELMRKRFATRSDVDREVAEGDVVTLDINASEDGKEIEDAQAQGITYTVGAPGMLEGMAEAITGKKAGDEVDFKSTLLGGPLRGSMVDIHVAVRKVQEEKLPEVDDEFAQLVSEFDTVSEMREDLASHVLRVARLEQAQEARDKVLEDLVSKVDFELPQGLVEREIQARTEQINNQLAQAGYTLERYLEESEDEPDTPEEFWAQLADRTRQGLAAQIVLDKLADENEIKVENTELTEMLFRRAAQNGTSPEHEMQHMMEHNHAGEWMQEIRRSKALQTIVEAATVTDTDGNTIDVSAVRPDGTLAEPEVESDDAETDEAGQTASE